MARHPLPNEIKRRRGTLRAGRVASPGLRVELLNSAQIPTPPEHLGEIGLETWRQLWQAGASWVSQGSDWLLVLMTCELTEEREDLRELLQQEPEDWRQRAALREIERQLTRQLGLLGFTPSDRARLGFIEVKRESKLDELRRKLEGD